MVASYTSNSMTHTLTDATDSLVSGKIYKFKYEAVNAIGNSGYSSIVRFGLCDKPSAPGTPTIMSSLTT